MTIKIDRMRDMLDEMQDHCTLEQMEIYMERLARNGGDEGLVWSAYLAAENQNQWMDELFYQQGTKPKQRPKPYPNPVHHPRGFENPSKLSSVATELVKRGYPTEDVGKILGGNWMRLLGSVWKR